MASTVPAKSQPLHNFDLPHLKWNKDGQSSGHKHRRRSIKSPLRRPNPSSVSPLCQSPLRDSVSAPSPHRQSPLRDSVSPSPLESPDNLVKQSPIRGGESSKPSPVREWVKHSPIGGDSVKHSPNRGDSVRKLPKRDFATESEALRRNKGVLVEYRRNPTRNSAYESIKNGVYASTSERVVGKSEKKQKVTEVDATGIHKSKILIKIPCKNKSEEDNTLDEPQKIDNNDEDDVTDEVEEEGKINTNDEETKTWNLRPRKPTSKCLIVNGAGMKINWAAMPDKNKAQSPLRNVTNRSGENEGNCGGGIEKKEKRKLSISIALSKEEIEEDIFSLTGSKPARRPKKRAKNIQKLVDFVFPGTWLVSITPDLYKVSENYLKG